MATSLLVLALVGGCYWFHYEGLVVTHVDLLQQGARDARDAVAVGRRPSDDDAQRLRYPFERARRFVAAVTSSDRDSRRELEALLEAYAELLAELDLLRLGAAAPAASDDALATLDRLVARIDDHAAKARAALDAE